MIDFQRYHNDTRTAGDELKDRMRVHFPNARVVGLRFITSRDEDYGCAVVDGGELKSIFVEEAHYDAGAIASSFSFNPGAGRILASVQPSDGMGFVGKIHHYVEDEGVVRCCKEVASEISKHMQVLPAPSPDLS